MEHNEETIVGLSKFVIRHQKLRTAPPSGDITMTSFPVCKKTSLPLNHIVICRYYLSMPNYFE